jgi:hypothetical protein
VLVGRIGPRWIDSVDVRIDRGIVRRFCECRSFRAIERGNGGDALRERWTA